jgi:hypothetical protein
MRILEVLFWVLFLPLHIIIGFVKWAGATKRHTQDTRA